MQLCCCISINCKLITSPLIYVFFFNLLSCICVSFSWQSGNSMQQRAEAWRNEVDATRELEARRPPPLDSFINSGVGLQPLIVFKEQPERANSQI